MTPANNAVETTIAAIRHNWRSDVWTTTMPTCTAVALLDVFRASVDLLQAIPEQKERDITGELLAAHSAAWSLIKAASR